MLGAEAAVLGGVPPGSGAGVWIGPAGAYGIVYTWFQSVKMIHQSLSGSGTF